MEQFNFGQTKISYISEQKEHVLWNTSTKMSCPESLKRHGFAETAKKLRKILHGTLGI